MPVDTTAKTRAIVWFSICAVVLVTLPALYFWTWTPALILPIIALLAWPVNAAYVKKKSIDLLKPEVRKLIEEHDRPDVYPVLITVTRGDWLIGHDLGLLRFENHRMVFEGMRTDFDVHIRDVTYGTEDNSIAILNDEKNATELNIRIDLAWPLDVPDASQRGDRYLDVRDHFWRGAKTKTGESVLPPNVPFSSGELRVHQPFSLMVFAFISAHLVTMPVRLAGVALRTELVLMAAVHVLALLGVWLYLRQAYPKALARIGSQDRRTPRLTVVEN
jgi:hypothetical protein